jgi:hypothetical protein
VSAHDALRLLDSEIKRYTTGPDSLLGRERIVSLLDDIREVLTQDPEWSEVQHSKMRAEVDGARAELASEQMATTAAAALYEAALRHVEGERDRARALAVRLEQDLALAATGIQRRAL